MKKIYAVLNSLLIAFVIFWNYWVNTGNLNGKTVGGLSAEYANLFTPAGYAFAIWGIIFIGLIVLAINQLWMAFGGKDDRGSIIKMGPWLLLTNLGNVAWLWFWLQEQTGMSVTVMLIILASLSMIVIRLDLENWDAPMSVIIMEWWPITVYFGWISVATIANISAWLAKLEWSWLLSELQWTLVMISIAATLNIIMVLTRNMREFAAVGIWALLAIAVRHWDSIEIIQWTCIFWIAVLVVLNSVHGFKNRKSNPFYKMIVKN
jgi:hypothetical protein